MAAAQSSDVEAGYRDESFGELAAIFVAGMATAFIFVKMIEILGGRGKWKGAAVDQQESNPQMA